MKYVSQNLSINSKYIRGGAKIYRHVCTICCVSISERGKIKGKIFLVHAIKAYRGNEGIVPLILSFSTR
jgi:hypothetical protein